MAASVLYMSMSLDGFVAGPNDSPNNPGGDDEAIERLHRWGLASETARRLLAEYDATGAMVSGRNTAEQADHWGGSHHGVPTFVLSRRPPSPAVTAYPKVTYVDDLESAMKQARAAAGDRDILVQGAYTAQRALEAGLLDEIQLHQIPVLLGSGRRLFDVLPTRTELDIVRVIDTPEATHLRYRIAR